MLRALIVTAAMFHAPVVSADDWSGLRFGLYSGVLQADDAVEFETRDVSGRSYAVTNEDADGVLAAGVLAGVNQRIQSIVAGVRLEFEPFSGKRQLGCRVGGEYGFNSNVLISFDEASTCSLHANWSGSAIGQLGYLITDATLVYVLAGWSKTSVEHAVNFYNLLPPVQLRLSGVIVGAGVERRIEQNWHLFGEVRAVFYDGGDQVAGFTSFGAPETRTIRVDADELSARIGLSYSLD